MESEHRENILTAKLDEQEREKERYIHIELGLSMFDT